MSTLLVYSIQSKGRMDTMIRAPSASVFAFFFPSERLFLSSAFVKTAKLRMGHDSQENLLQTFAFVHRLQVVERAVVFD